jgi:hypothetical protein
MLAAAVRVANNFDPDQRDVPATALSCWMTMHRPLPRQRFDRALRHCPTDDADLVRGTARGHRRGHPAFFPIGTSTSYTPPADQHRHDRRLYGFVGQLTASRSGGRPRAIFTVNKTWDIQRSHPRGSSVATEPYGGTRPTNNSPSTARVGHRHYRNSAWNFTQSSAKATRPLAATLDPGHGHHQLLAPACRLASKAPARELTRFAVARKALDAEGGLEHRQQERTTPV